ncbi:MAG: hypothetical protein A2908_02880 [Candidatus Staskawiczbacteria bacterium RIFCSPLOWO2_01_FULL_38_12b]|uniref:Endolytic murein transglycosylase n=1 Tax=Candidatus Staskawiczbacteria bacterium RIFCSPLOWO2_01_FULL_38_12b TaxID=1802214 RepID=A0A1G2IHR8_9BACT|nr:MAG: hypothetical protein A2908_02880 [Candidatus Staskawiczbacteria bacterium RIFCSPLOWO2_01_FULL_38_12b]
MNTKNKKRVFAGFCLFCTAIISLWVFEVYVPHSFSQKTTTVYRVQKGFGEREISRQLQEQGLIKQSMFFNLYVMATGNHGALQAGNYALSPSMSIAKMVKKFVLGDVVKNNITIIEGWDIEDIAAYLEDKSIYPKKDFFTASLQDFSIDYDFLKDKPKTSGLEGYIFPDTYQISAYQSPKELVQNALNNLDKKLTPDMKKEIIVQHKSIFQIITMASILEKEVKTLEDKKIVAGILWKRMDSGMPLQVDATINYITGKNNRSALIKDTKIDSPYNTYKYTGLPQGPICNPGWDSILAAIYPKSSPYWYYLSAKKTGTTIFSKTFQEHNLAAYHYL